MLVALRGDHSDCASTLAELEFVCNQHIKSYNFVLSCESIAQFYRKIVTDSLNRSHQLKVDALIGGLVLPSSDKHKFLYSRSIF